MRWLPRFRSTSPAPPPVPPIDPLVAVDNVVAAMVDAGSRLLALIDGQALGPVPLSRSEGLELTAAFVRDGALFHAARQDISPVLASALATVPDGTTPWPQHFDNLLATSETSTRLAHGLIAAMTTGEAGLTTEELRALRPSVDTHLAQCREIRQTVAAQLEANRVR